MGLESNKGMSHTYSTVLQYHRILLCVLRFQAALFFPSFATGMELQPYRIIFLHILTNTYHWHH
jgi:hypothetical protein